MGEDDAALARAEALDPGDHRLEGMVLGLIALVAHARQGRWMSARGLAQNLAEEHRAMGIHDRDIVVLLELGLAAAAGGDATVRGVLEAMRAAC